MDIHFNSYKTKYEMLDRFTFPITKSRRINTMNIFINFDDVFHTMHRPQVNAEFISAGSNAYIQCASNMMNLIAHYKNWGIRNHIRTTVYGVLTTSKGPFNNEIYVDQYRSHYLDINSLGNEDLYYINNTLKDAVPLVKAIAMYLPNIYMIDSSTVEPSIIPKYISELRPADLNLLVTRDRYDYQYAYQDKWLVLSPKGENSYVINQNTLWKYIAQKEKIEYDLSYPCELYPTCIAITGDRYRNIPRLRRIGWKTLFKHFEKIKTMTDVISHTILNNLIREELRAKSVSVETLNQNLICSDVNLQVDYLSEVMKMNIDNMLIDKIDFNAVYTLNKTIFRFHPLNTIFLTTDIKS